MTEKTKRYIPLYIITMVIVLLPIVFGLIYYDALPKQVAIHFSLTGIANGFCPKAIGVFATPLIEIIGQIIMILSFSLSSKKVSKWVEIISLFIFPVISIISTVVIYNYNLAI